MWNTDKIIAEDNLQISAPSQQVETMFIVRSLSIIDNTTMVSSESPLNTVRHDIRALHVIQNELSP